MKDNGGRRFITDRRKSSSLGYFPERRTLRFRRGDLDRRQAQAKNNANWIERRGVFNKFNFPSIGAVDRLHFRRTT
jgi:hypothetical protein